MARGHSCPVQGRGKCRASLPGAFPNLLHEVVLLIPSEGRGRKEGQKGGWWPTDPSEVAFVEMSDARVSSRLH